MTKVLLNLGCGHKPQNPPGEGWAVINHDLTLFAKHVSETWDLNEVPWPWADNTIIRMQAHSVFEHLQITLVESMNEAWRIMAERGRIDLKLPLWSRDRSYLDPTHRWFVALGVLDNFDPGTERGKTYGVLYGIKPWRVITQQADDGATCLRGVLEVRK